MIAKEAIDGQFYFVRRRNAGLEWQKALCQGWNYSKQWLLFLVITDENKRQILTVLPNEEIKEQI